MFVVTKPTHRQVLSGKAPYPEIRNEGALMHAILKGDRPRKPEEAEGLGFTTRLWEVVQRCWSVNVRKRPDAREMLFELNFAAKPWERTLTQSVHEALVRLTRDR